MESAQQSRAPPGGGTPGEIGAGRGGARLGQRGCVREACAPGEGRSGKRTLARCQRASVVATFPRSARSGDGDMRGGGTGAALLVLLASVLWVTVQSQQRGEPRDRNTGDTLGAGACGWHGTKRRAPAWGRRTHPGAARTYCGPHGAGTPFPEDAGAPGAFGFGFLWFRPGRVGVARFLVSEGPYVPAMQ